MTHKEIMDIASATRRYNFHSHTEFCDGRASVAEFAEAAVGAGFRHYGFSPHSPLPIESPCNMAAADIDRFFAEVDAASVRYADADIKFYKAMEVDFLDDSWGPASPYFQSLGLDYKIGSVHFVPSDDGFVDVDGKFDSFKIKVDRYFKGDIRHVVELFYSQTRRMLELGGFEILGHFDKIGNNASCYRPGIEEEIWYRKTLGDLMDLIAEKHVIAELNTKAWEQQARVFPGPRYHRRLRELGVPMVVNSDAHYTNLINASRDEAFAMLQAAGFKLPNN